MIAAGGDHQLALPLIARQRRARGCRRRRPPQLLPVVLLQGQRVPSLHLDLVTAVAIVGGEAAVAPLQAFCNDVEEDAQPQQRPHNHQSQQEVATSGPVDVPAAEEANADHGWSSQASLINHIS